MNLFSRNKLAMLLAEMLGTALLATIVLSVANSAVGVSYFVATAAGFTVAVGVLALGAISGAHLNPAVTVGMWTTRQISTIKAIMFVAMQLFGGLVALKLYEYLTNTVVPKASSVAFDWRILVAEIIGAFIFTFAIAAAVYQKQDATRTAAIVGAGLFLGILVAAVASKGYINPAVALANRDWSRAYIFGPIIGGILGMNLYALLFAPQSTLVGRSAASLAGSSKRKSSSKKK